MSMAFCNVNAGLKDRISGLDYQVKKNISVHHLVHPSSGPHLISYSLNTLVFLESNRGKIIFVPGMNYTSNHSYLELDRFE